jgi:purine-binding chemotaxis protein CheW
MNLRGSILTLIDIRPLLEIPPGKFDRSSQVVVVSGEDFTVGIAVDEIHDIVPFSQTDISPLPATTPNFGRGTSRYGDRAMTILDVGEILRSKLLKADP